MSSLVPLLEWNLQQSEEICQNDFITFWLASENATATAILQVQLSHKDASNSAWIVVTFGVAVVALVRSQWAFMRSQDSKADLKILSPIPWRTSLLPCQPWVKVLSDAKLFPNLSGSRISAFELPAEYTAEFYSNSASEYSHLSICPVFLATERSNACLEPGAFCFAMVAH